MKVFIAFSCLAYAAASGLRGEFNATQPVSRRNVVPKGWIKGGRADRFETVEFKVALKQRNLKWLNEEFEIVSNPTHSRYQQFLEIDEILDKIAPTKADHDAAKAFLVQSGGCEESSIKSHRDALLCTTDVKSAERLFNTEMHYFYFHPKASGGRRKARKIIRHWGDYTVPKTLLKYADFVVGISDFPMTARRTHRANTGPDPTEYYSYVPNNGPQQGNVLPLTIHDLMGIPKGTKASSKSSQGVVEYGSGESFAPSDLKAFKTDAGITGTVSTDHIVGPYNANSPGVESSLDIEYLLGVGQGATNWFWTESNWLYDWATTFFNTKEVPYVVSHSYGWAESQQCTSGIGSSCSTLGVDSAQYVARVNTEYQKIGLRGVSIIVASGDAGANGKVDQQCTGSKFNPTFPAASPYVTAVGALQVSPSDQSTSSSGPPGCDAAVEGAGTGCLVSGTQEAVSYTESSFTSGGGFSGIAPMPSWQKTVVQAYLKNKDVSLPPSSYFSSKNRAYPDVSAMGHNFVVYVSGQSEAVGGTSAASPSFAGLVGLLNSESLAKNGKPLGFLNPLLYTMAKAKPATFIDVTTGSNACTEDGCASSCEGFNAAKGWDPVTGLGVPQYSQMLAYIKSQ